MTTDNIRRLREAPDDLLLSELALLRRISTRVGRIAAKMSHPWTGDLGDGLRGSVNLDAEIGALVDEIARRGLVL